MSSEKKRERENLPGNFMEKFWKFTLKVLEIDEIRNLRGECQINLIGEELKISHRTTLPQILSACQKTLVPTIASENSWKFPPTMQDSRIKYK
jgi:hypothetical protein